MKKTILIIGGAGFVGSNLCKKLSHDNFVVYSYDNYFTGNEENHHKNVKYIQGESKNINEVEFGVNFDIIYHLGEYSRVEQSFDDIDRVFEYNMSSIYSVLKFTLKHNAKIIYSGSSTKFGDDGDNILASPYAWTKKTNAELVKTYCSWFGLDYCITYFYNVYGDNEISEGLYATLIAKYIKMYNSGIRQLPVVKPGNQRRNFTHIDDIVSGLIIIGEKGSGDNYGIGSDTSYSIVDIVELFKAKIEWLPERKGNRMSAPIISEKTKALGWSPKNQLDKFINKKINHA
jgi:UDP-glucose 4-epimerase